MYLSTGLCCAFPTATGEACGLPVFQADTDTGTALLCAAGHREPVPADGFAPVRLARAADGVLTDREVVAPMITDAQLDALAARLMLPRGWFRRDADGWVRLSAGNCRNHANLAAAIEFLRAHAVVYTDTVTTRHRPRRPQPAAPAPARLAAAATAIVEESDEIGDWMAVRHGRSRTRRCGCVTIAGLDSDQLCGLCSREAHGRDSF